MRNCYRLSVLCLALFFYISTFAQEAIDPSLLTIDRIYNSGDLYPQRMPAVQWMNKGETSILLNPSKDIKGAFDLVSINTANQRSKVLLSAKQLIPKNADQPIAIESFNLSHDETKVLIFNNSKKVWRSNTKGDYWVYDLETSSLKQLGKDLPKSSLMFAKFSTDNKYVAYVSGFNIYTEDYKTGVIKQLTTDGTGAIINGTFDWVYEEEFGCRDGFRWSPKGTDIAFWQLDASNSGTFYMINNTDSIYSQMVPVQYPKVGEEPSACKVGLINSITKEIKWIDLGDQRKNYIPRMQWVDDDYLLIQQINRKQNHLTVWKYQLSNQKLSKIYEEKEKTWVDISYPDITANGWGMHDLELVEDNKSFLRLSENDGWRHIYKIDIATGNKTVLTKGDYDVASIYAVSKTAAFFSASPDNSTERYLYQINLDGKGKATRVTPKGFKGVNSYKVSPNASFAIHSHSNIHRPPTTHLVKLPTHDLVKTFIDNEAYKKKMSELRQPEEEFFKVTTSDGIEVDGHMIKPIDFDPKKKYPVLFYVYGEPWGQIATNTWSGLWEKMLAQQGYFVIRMDNRGTPCLKGSEWRKSIYRKIGVLNSRDQAMAAKEVLKWNFIDADRVAVWGWSGGGSMTLNLLFRYPEIYKTGMAVAAVANQLYYDNVYQERYMGLPAENLEDFIEGSPITYAKKLKGNLLLIHGTGDDNVHYQNAEALINELIKQNKQFDLMIYPNRSHGIYEGENTSRHLRTLLTNYLHEHVPAGGK